MNFRVQLQIGAPSTLWSATRLNERRARVVSYAASRGVSLKKQTEYRLTFKLRGKCSALDTTLYFGAQACTCILGHAAVRHCPLRALPECELIEVKNLWKELGT